MRPLFVSLSILLAASFPGFAQRGGGGHAGGGGGMRAGAGFRGGGGVARGGFRGGGGIHGGGGPRGGFGLRPGYRFRGVYPIYYGGFGLWPYTAWYPNYWYPDTYGYDDSGSGYANDYAYQPSASSPVIINQQFQTPAEPNAVLRQYSYTPPPMPEPTPSQPPTPPAPSAASKYGTPLYLLAFNDGVIRAALAYWAQGSTLHYVTMDHDQKQVPLASIDRSLSQRLNSERNVTFQLPR